MSFTGRPTIFTPQIAEAVAQKMACGYSLEAAAAAVGIAPRTAYYWAHSHPEFLQSIEWGRAAALLFWETRAIEVAQGAAGNSGLIILALRNRSRSASGWDASLSKVEISAPIGVPARNEEAAAKIDVRSLTREQRDMLKQLLLAARATVEENAAD